MKKLILLFLTLASALLNSCNNLTISETITDCIPSEKIVFNSDRSGNHELYIMDTDGSETAQLTNDVNYENWWAKISPDREKILFYRTPRGFHEDYTKTSLWVYDYRKKTIHVLRNAQDDDWVMQGHAEWSPDGKKIAMFGGTGPFLQIFVTDSEGKNPIQYTNKDGYNTDVSWSPDGKKLIFNGYPEKDYSREKYELYVMDAIPFSEPTRLTNDNMADYDPYYSPDGTKIAWIVNTNPLKGEIGAGLYLGDWAIKIANSDGTNAEYLIHDGNINSKPSWSLDGETIFFHRMEYDPLVEYTFGIFSIDIETKVITRLTALNTGSNEYPGN